jgi:RND family efflux transporter MFP subunit
MPASRAPTATEGTVTNVPPTRPRTRLRPLLTFFSLLALIVIIAVVAGLLPRLQRRNGLATAAEQDRVQKPVVNVTAAHQASANTPLDLPGDLQALIESPIYARADGYLVKRNVDIGDHVKPGQVMAEIETPELDQQIQQARATLSNSVSSLKELEANLTLARANLGLARQTAQRWQELEKKGAVAHQDADEKRADLDVKQAQLEAAQARIVSTRDLINANEANLHRLEQMKAYSHVTAPFEGMVTARNVDVGVLINSGNGGPAKAMFSVAQTAILRIFVNIPQANLASVRTGETAELRVQELPGQVFQATVSRFTHEVDPTSRSMLAILQVPNPHGILLPGMYAQVRFAGVRSTPGTVLIPGDALIMSPQGTRVAIVDADNRVHFRGVKVGIDYGGDIEILSGLSSGDLVVMHAGDSIKDGVEVDVHKGTAP